MQKTKKVYAPFFRKAVYLQCIPVSCMWGTAIQTLQRLLLSFLLMDKVYHISVKCQVKFQSFSLTARISSTTPATSLPTDKSGTPTMMLLQ